ncbi:MAG: dTDP-4-dehydrorhamnose reductase [Erysipelotrichaceae bacterium]|nr:dTDP-4-dehydrorhamnose reductase [Erysipelotrichaceae bacterium]
MKVLVTGASGLVGGDIADAFAAKGHEVIRLNGRKDLDLTDINGTIIRIVSENPDIIVHAAALKDVDEAERNPEYTFVNNSLATRNVALAARKADAAIVYISTDAVFSGEKGSPYHEYDQTGPINVYGFSKLAGENEIKSLCSRYYIIRTGLQFGLKGHPERNMALNLIRRWEKGEVVDAGIDQVCSNTYTHDLAEALVKISLSGAYGTYHVVNSGEASRYEFYKKLCVLAGFSEDLVNPVEAATIKFARRQRYSPLISLTYESLFHEKMPDWQNAAERFMEEYRRNKGEEK